MPRNLNEIQFQFWPLKLLAKGPVAFMMAGAVCVFIIALAWRLVQ